MNSIAKVKRLAFASMLVAGPLAAQQDSCELDPARAGVKIAHLDRQPSWFISVNPNNSNLVGYIGGSNRIVNMSLPRGDESREIVIPGSIDPVYSPDGLFMTTPMQGLAFIPLDALEAAFTEEDKSAADIEPLYTDSEMSGAYQSIGMPLGFDGETLADGRLKKTYRGIIERNDSGPSTLSVRDYSFFIEADGELSDEVETTELRTLCPDRKLKTPKISKTGRYLAAYDFEAEVTKIFKIVDGHRCEEIPGVDFSLHTGKVDFNFDDSMITFHLSRFEGDSEHRGFWPSTIADYEKRDVYVAKLIKGHDGDLVAVGSMTRVSPPTSYGEGAWYPSFSRDDTLVYMTRSLNVTGDTVHSLVKIDPLKDMEYTPFLFGDVQLEGDEQLRQHATYALAALAGESCNWGDAASIDNLLMDISILKPASCQSLASSTFADKKAAIKDYLKASTAADRLDFGVIDRLTADDLAASCSSRLRTPVEDLDGGVAVDEKPEITINTTCGYCHTHGSVEAIRYIDFSNPRGLSLEDLNLSIHSVKYEPQPAVFSTPAEQERELGRKMPSSETFDERTKEKILCYFYRVRAEKYPDFEIPDHCFSGESVAIPNGDDEAHGEELTD